MRRLRLFGVTTLLLLAGLLFLLPQRVAYAATHNIHVSPGSPTVVCDRAGDEYTIFGTGSGHAVSISGGSAANPVYVTLDGFTVEASGGRGDGNAPVQVNNGYCVLRLRGQNRLVSGWHDITLKKDEGIAALRVRGGATCVVTSAEGDGSTSGSLYAECTHDDHGGAGIGSNYNEDTGSIVIRGGTIEAHGGHCGAGIGSGRDGVCTSVAIEGGDVTAYGGEYAAGIGGGDAVGASDGGDVRDLRISGGTVRAFGGNNGGAGIGGSEGGDVGTITITGGTITARGCGRSGEKGDGNAAGIGGGDGGAATIVIDQAEGTELAIDALGGWSGSHGGAGIGSANCTSKDISIFLRGGTIRAEGGEKAAGIGGGNKQSGAITIRGYGTVDAIAGRDGCAIGAGQQCHSGPITIQGSGPNTGACGYPLLIRAYGGSTRNGSQNGALIGSGDGSAGDISIRGASVSLEPAAGASLYGAGIGTGCSNDLSIKDGGIRKIEVRDATVRVSNASHMYGAGIGAGYNSNIGQITLENVTYTGPTIGTSCGNRVLTNANNMDAISIANSTIAATAVDHGDPWAGIGTGPYGAIGSISIDNSSVEAKGTCGGAGIGTGGLEMTGFDLEMAVSGAGKCGSVSITGPPTKTITATGSGGGAGIGGGQCTSAEGSILVRSVTVVARSGSDGGAGIGGGSMCSANEITISGADVRAEGGPASAGIGSSGFDDTSWVSGIMESSWNTVCGNVSIQSGSTVVATGGDGGAGIGLGQGAQQKNGTWLKVDGSTVTATGGDGAAGIGAGGESGLGRGAEGKRISITGQSKVEARGGAGGAGIGGGYQGGLESCSIVLTDYYHTDPYGSKEARAWVRAYGGAGAAGIGGGASSHDAGNKGTLDGGHDAKSLTIGGGFVAAYGGDGSDSHDGAGASGPGAGIGGGSHQGDLEGLTVTGGVVIARAGRKAGISGAVSAQDIGHGGSRSGDGTGGDGSDSIAIQDGTVLSVINENETVRVSGGSVAHAFSAGVAKNYESQGGQDVYQTSFKVDTDYLPCTTFEGETFYRLSDLSTSAAYYGCDHVFARKVGADEDHRAQVWLYLPASAPDASTADFHFNSNTASANTVRHYFGTTSAGKPLDFSTDATAETNVLKMGAPIALEPDGSTPVPYEGEHFRLNVADTSHALSGTTLTYDATNATIVGDQTQPIVGTSTYVTMTPAAAGQTLTATAAIEGGGNPKSDIFWGSTATYSAQIQSMPLSVRITSDPSRTYNGEEIDDPSVEVTGTTEPVVFAYAGEGLSGADKPREPGTYTVTATATKGGDSASDTRSFAICKYRAVIQVSAADTYYTGEPVLPEFAVTAKEADPVVSYDADANGEVVATYDKSVPSGWVHVSAPVDVGFYRVKAHAKESDHYEASSTVPAFFSILEAPARVDPYLHVEMPESLVYNNAPVDDPVVWTSSDCDANEVTLAYYEGTEPQAGKRLSQAPKDVGTYCVVVSVPQTQSHNAASKTCSFAVEPRPATLTIAANPSGENGATVVVRLANGLADVVGADVRLMVAKDGQATRTEYASLDSACAAAFSFADVGSGTYTLTAHFENKNYVVADVTRDFEKEFKEYVVSLSDATMTYGDASFFLTADVTDGDGSAAGNPNLTYALAPSAADDVIAVSPAGEVTILNVGTTTVQATMPADATHRAGSATAAVTVLQAQPTLTLAAHDKLYDADPATVVCTVSDDLSSEDVALTYYKVVGAQRTPLESAPADPGSYLVAGTLPESRNYMAAVAQDAYVIHPYTAKLEVVANSKVCDGAPATVWSGVSARETDVPAKEFGEGGGAVRYEYAKLEDGTWVDLAEAPTQAGSYRVTAYATGDAFYTAATADALFELTPAKQDTHIRLDAQSKAFDGEPAVATAVVLDADDEPVEGLVADLVYYQSEQDGTWVRLDGAPSQIGSYGVRAQTAGNDAYNPSEARAAFQIVDVPTQPVDPYLFVDMPATFVYDMRMVTDPEVFTNSDGKVSIAYFQGGTRLGTPPVNAGTYTVVVSTAATDAYNAAAASRTFVVEPRPAKLSLAARADKRKVGAQVRASLANGLADLVGEVVRLDIAKDGLAGSSREAPMEDKSGNLVARYTFGQVDDGEYTLTATMTNPNYVVLPATCAFDKNKAHYYVDAQNATVTFGDEPFAIQASVVTDDGLEVHNPTLSYEVATDPDLYPALADDVVSMTDGQAIIRNAGLAAVHVEAASDSSHVGGDDYALVTVERAGLPLELAVHDKAYDGKPIQVACTVADEKFPTAYTGRDAIELRYYRLAQGSKAQSKGVAAEAADSDVDLSTAQALDAAPREPGSYVVVATAAGDRNYEAAVKQAQFSITTAPLPDDPTTPEKPDDSGSSDATNKTDATTGPHATAASRSSVPHTGDATTPLAWALALLGIFAIWRGVRKN